MKTMKTLRSQSGFSLIELMVVVAIIGILATMSVGAVQKQIAKARQAEAKTNLSGLFTAEKTFQSEYASYCGDWGAIGYDVEGGLRYGFGFTAIGVTAAAVPGFNAAGNGRFNSGTSPNTTQLTGYAAPVGGVVAAGAFTAAANSTHYKGFVDRWTIDQAKTLTNATNALAAD